MANHLFQYMYLVHQAKDNEKIVVIGMTELFRVFKNLPHSSRVWHLSTTDNRWLRACARLCIDRSFSFLARHKIISSYAPKIQGVKGSYTSETGEIICLKGFLSKITYARGNFQSPMLYDENDIQQLVISEKHLQKARQILAPYPEKKLIFVHIRRGDYLKERFRPLGQSAALPGDYYLRAIQKYKNSTTDNLLFVVVTDDCAYAQSLLSECVNKIICSNTMPVDFSLLSLCHGGILSASSFSYWGALLAIHCNKAEMNFYAPKYWLGFRSKTWFPTDISNQFLRYITVY